MAVLSNYNYKYIPYIVFIKYSSRYLIQHSKMNDSVNKQASALLFIEKLITQVNTIMPTSMTAPSDKYRTLLIVVTKPGYL